MCPYVLSAIDGEWPAWRATSQPYHSHKQFVGQRTAAESRLKSYRWGFDEVW